MKNDLYLSLYPTKKAFGHCWRLANNTFSRLWEENRSLYQKALSKIFHNPNILAAIKSK